MASGLVGDRAITHLRLLEADPTLASALSDEELELAGRYAVATRGNSRTPYHFPTPISPSWSGLSVLRFRSL